MKTKITSKGEKNLDLFISKINSNEILGVTDMILVRGGEGTEQLPPPPPDFPKLP